MRASYLLPLPLLLVLAACGPSLTRGPTGWVESGNPYSITALDGGALAPDGWALAGYAVVDGGYRRTMYGPIDFELHRTTDDGVLAMTHYTLDEPDRAKVPDALADRWIERVVQKPDEDDGVVHAFAPIVTPLTTNVSGRVGLRRIDLSTVHGHSTQIDHRETFELPGADATELTATLAPAGSSTAGASSDRRLYLAVVKPKVGNEYVLLAYANTPSRFDSGLQDARAMVRRLRF